MSPCLQCKKKVGLMALTCRECSEHFCTRCIQLEMHKCPKLDGRGVSERVLLEKKLIKVVAAKVQKI